MADQHKLLKIRKPINSGGDQVKPLSLMLALPPLVFMLTSLSGPVQAQQEFDRTVLSAMLN